MVEAEPKTVERTNKIPPEYDTQQILKDFKAAALKTNNKQILNLEKALAYGWEEIEGFFDKGAVFTRDLNPLPYGGDSRRTYPIAIIHPDLKKDIGIRIDRNSEIQITTRRKQRGTNLLKALTKVMTNSYDEQKVDARLRGSYSPSHAARIIVANIAHKHGIGLVG